MREEIARKNLAIPSFEFDLLSLSFLACKKILRMKRNKKKLP